VSAVREKGWSGENPEGFMFTRFRTLSTEYLMSLSEGVPPKTPGKDFLDTLAFAYQESMKVSRRALLKSARVLLKFVTENRHLLAYRYDGLCRPQDRGEWEKVRLARGGGLVGVSGFKVDRRAHSLWVGDGECYLERKASSGRGARQETERIDVRERKTIETDDWGIIKITRRKRAFSLPEELAKCISYLESVSDSKITLFSFDEPPTVGDLVEDFGEGGDHDDWVLEEIAREPGKWRPELLAALKQRPFAFHRATIIQLLLLSFRDAKTRSAVVKSINALPRKYRGELLALVAELGE
jgi:hypothetical protein